MLHQFSLPISVQDNKKKNRLESKQLMYRFPLQMKPEGSSLPTEWYQRRQLWHSDLTHLEWKKHKTTTMNNQHMKIQKHRQLEKCEHNYLLGFRLNNYDQPTHHRSLQNCCWGKKSDNFWVQGFDPIAAMSFKKTSQTKSKDKQYLTHTQRHVISFMVLSSYDM